MKETVQEVQRSDATRSYDGIPWLYPSSIMARSHLNSPIDLIDILHRDCCLCEATDIIVYDSSFNRLGSVRGGFKGRPSRADWRFEGGHIKVFASGTVSIMCPWDKTDPLESIWKYFYSTGASICAKDISWTITQLMAQFSHDGLILSSIQPKIGGKINTSSRSGNSAIRGPGWNIFARSVQVYGKTIEQIKDIALHMHLLISPYCKILDVPRIVSKPRMCGDYMKKESSPPGYYPKPDKRGKIKLYKLPTEKTRHSPLSQKRMLQAWALWSLTPPGWVLDAYKMK
jgi:hypothetical protein